MKTYRYEVTITAPDDPNDCELHAVVIGPNGRSQEGSGPIVPLLNQIKATIADDIERRL